MAGRRSHGAGSANFWSVTGRFIADQKSGCSGKEHGRSKGLNLMPPSCVDTCPYHAFGFPAQGTADLRRLQAEELVSECCTSCQSFLSRRPDMIYMVTCSMSAQKIITHQLVNAQPCRHQLALVACRSNFRVSNEGPSNRVGLVLVACCFPCIVDIASVDAAAVVVVVAAAAAAAATAELSCCCC